MKKYNSQDFCTLIEVLRARFGNESIAAKIEHIFGVSDISELDPLEIAKGAPYFYKLLRENKLVAVQQRLLSFDREEEAKALRAGILDLLESAEKLGIRRQVLARFGRKNFMRWNVERLAVAEEAISAMVLEATAR